MTPGYWRRSEPEFAGVSEFFTAEVAHALNLSRAEVAYKEVLKRAPNDLATLEKLVEIYKRQGDIAKAVETQQVIVAEARAIVADALRGA